MNRLLISGIVLVLAVAGIAFHAFGNGNMIGRVVDGTPFERSDSCSDSDGGVFSFEKGEVVRKGLFGSKGIYRDRCMDVDGKDAVKEYYCEEGKAKWEKIACEERCENRACIPREVLPQIISSCREITSGGSYLFNGDIYSSGQTRCLYIHDTENVQIDCNNHTIFSNLSLGYLVYFERVNNFSLKSCRFMALEGLDEDFYPLYIENSSDGEVEKNLIRGKFFRFSNSVNLTFFHNTIIPRLDVFHNKGLKIYENDFRREYYQQYTTNSLIQRNTFNLSYIRRNQAENISCVINLNLGSENNISQNRINGGARGLFSERLYADDGICLSDESFDFVEGNFIENNWDAGIETIGLVTNTTITENYIKNSGLTGLGGWYWNSWKGNSVLNNVIEDAPKMLFFLREHGLRPQGWDDEHLMPADKFIIFKDNTFINNSILNPRIDELGSYSYLVIQAKDNLYPGESYPKKEEVILGNNLFKDNDFTHISLSPYFDPPSMIIDGGGNKCNSPSDSEYPLSCV